MPMISLHVMIKPTGTHEQTTALCSCPGWLPHTSGVFPSACVQSPVSSVWAFVAAYIPTHWDKLEHTPKPDQQPPFSSHWFSRFLFILSFLPLPKPQPSLYFLSPEFSICMYCLLCWFKVLFLSIFWDLLLQIYISSVSLIAFYHPIYFDLLIVLPTLQNSSSSMKLQRSYFP